VKTDVGGGLLLGYSPGDTEKNHGTLESKLLVTRQRFTEGICRYTNLLGFLHHIEELERCFNSRQMQVYKRGCDKRVTA
jgi:hypothetical protein